MKGIKFGFTIAFLCFMIFVSGLEANDAPKNSSTLAENNVLNIRDKSVAELMKMIIENSPDESSPDKMIDWYACLLYVEELGNRGKTMAGVAIPTLRVARDQWRDHKKRLTDSSKKAQAKTVEYYLLDAIHSLGGNAFKKDAVLPRFSAGTGIPAFSVKLGPTYGKERAIGIMDAIMPIAITVNLKQYSNKWFEKDYRMAFWVMSAGVGASTIANRDMPVFSAFFMPYGFRVNDFLFGIGLLYKSTVPERPAGKSKTIYDHFSITFVNVVL
ncbi:hypothetical protein CL633_01110 [bacterium]|nr:hypothetical protein [bacterium]|tara:strand:+ start:96 stop:908 length:813 start_codon:yes stop_codon:yes gene_type:complete